MGTFPQHGLPLNKRLFKTFFPMGTFQFVGKVFSLAATSSCSVATVASIRSLSPLFIVMGYRIYYGVVFPLQTYISLVPLVLGVVLIMISQYGGTVSKLSVYAEQMKQLDRDAAMLDDSSSSSSNLALYTLQYIKQTIDEEHEFFKGITFAFLATAVFASGSIYAKNVISSGAKSSFSAAPSSISNNLDANGNFKKNTFLEPKNRLMNLAKLALSSSQVNLAATNESSLDLEAQFRMKIDDEKYGSNEISHDIDDDLYIPDKLTTLMYCSIFGLIYSIPTFISYELPSLLFSHNSIEDSIVLDVDHTPHYLLIPWTLLIINGISYFAQSLLAFHILGALSTVSYSIAAMLKRIVIIGVSMLFLGTKIDFTGLVGLFHVGIGLWVYEKYGGRNKKGKFTRIE